MLPKLKVLFLCTGNACRSQMAEGWARQLLEHRLDSFSAGTAPGRVDPRAVRVMREVGVDISGQRSKHVEELGNVDFDWVVTVCDRAHEQCPVLPGTARRLHAGFDDPPRLIEADSTEEEALGSYRRVRDEIRSFVEGLPLRLESVNRKKERP